MRTVGIAELKNNLSRYLDEVKRGREILIKDRNRPVARIVPLGLSDDEETELLALAAEGKIKLPERESGLDQSFWKQTRPQVPMEAIQCAMRDDRDER
ncbi:MAG TPA: type II toxin-antitoxin system prevent-host-death family antitoxin [Blastocatellia bacterium]|nr:type II toxin-antitoxin system prevent-host-death family antitoxin [Blastocatellia bacterium]